MAWPLSFILSILPIILLQSQLPLNLIAAQTSGNISVGQSLTATMNGPLWLSPSGDFAFGFHKFNNNTNLFLLSIWYANIPDTIVWYANEGNPVQKGSTVKLDPTAGLNLSDPGGNQLWSTFTELTQPGLINSGFLNNKGNLVLTRRGDSVTIWQSFDHPTDTLLPTQTMQIGGVLDSQLTETNFTMGRFQMQFLNGDLVLNTRVPGFNSYYNYYYNSSIGVTNPGTQVVYNETGSMYILRQDGARFDLFSPGHGISGRDYYHRATLTFDGVVTWYYHPRNRTGSWSRMNSIPANICYDMSSYTSDSGACGFNSICSLGDDQRPICGCPPNYSLLDPDNAYGSCKPDFELDFCNGEGLYTLFRLPGVDFPHEDYAMATPCSEDSCKSTCVDDCFCAATVYERSSSTCWKKKLPLSNGGNYSQITRITWLKVGKDLDQYSVPTTGVKNKHNKAVRILLGGSAVVNFFLLCAIGLGIFFTCHKRKYRQYQNLHGSGSKALRKYGNIYCFSYQELEEATNGFTEELGRGAFGIVFKGMIKSESSNLVAVKKLDRISKDADKEFETEVNVIGHTHHKNLVRLVGFCKEEDQRLLVYEYMSNGSLADYLFHHHDSRPRWESRAQIALGIVRGLLYLHGDCSTQIIHCDIKPQNILLDDYHNARISDFGLAKLLVLNQTQTNTAIRGTKGYVAPEWFRNKPVTVKVDVYSFGVLLLEIICCRKNVCMELSVGEGAILTDWAFDCYRCGTLDSLVNDDMEVLNYREQLERFVMVALWCIQEDPSLRPTMRMVLQMLEGVAQVPDPPCPTSFSVTTQS